MIGVALIFKIVKIPEITKKKTKRTIENFFILDTIASLQTTKLIFYISDTILSIVISKPNFFNINIFLLIETKN